ncbi:MAG TPA: IS1595 family transposase [Allosphingosinicella sp.]|nr:IS1595 family transposase [Allosphingosinicella sp.]
MTNLTDPIFNNEEAARAHFEAIRWPDGRVCPHCGTIDNSVLMQGKTTRPGLYKCRDCRKPFTATMGTVYERSHIPLHKWLLATHLMVSSKKGISAHQLFRMLGFGSYRTGWFMAHRIREAMRSDDLTPFGSGGGAVEVDETFIGRLKGVPKAKRAFHHKMKVLALVDRDSGRARTMVIDAVNAETLMPIVLANVAREARVMTDEHYGYRHVKAHFADHGTTRHSADQYVDFNDRTIHSNTVEGYFSIFKRGMKGIYQHCGEQHLHRYLREFDFRYSNRDALGVSDAQRAVIAVQGTVGKRLTYTRPHGNTAH